MKRWLTPVAVLLLMTPGAVAGCRTQPPPPVQYSLPELKYLLLANFENVFWCDPDFYPIGRPGQEEANALEQLAAIRADQSEFAAILAHLGLPGKPDYTSEEKLTIYREHKKLAYALQVTESGGAYQFVLRVGEDQGERIEGTITSAGGIKVLKREPSINTCPICLTQGTLIDTPGGPIPVEELREGMAIWSVDGSGRRMVARVVNTTMTSVPPSFQALRVTLSDGRAVTASSSHRTGEGRALGDYGVGDNLNGATVVSIDSVPYDGGTYDLLPSGTTGLYWANGILLQSTLRNSVMTSDAHY